MSYAIISLGGKQYRVREGERLLVDRLPTEDGKTFTPDVLLVGGGGETLLAPTDVTVTVTSFGESDAAPSPPTSNTSGVNVLPSSVASRSTSRR